MQLPHWRCAAAVRMSFGPMADAAFIDAACARIAHCGEALRASCLIPSAMPVESRDGIVQLGVDGECTWLVLDAESRSCVVIDALAPLAGRIADFIRCQDYQVRAVIDTHRHEECGSGRTALLALLDGRSSGAARTDALGWPAAGQTIRLGRRMLARLPQQDGGACSATYLLGVGGAEGALAAHDVQFAFTGQAVSTQLAAVVGQHAILCSSSDAGSVPCTTLAALAAPAGTRTAAGTIEAAALEAFMKAHPDAVLVDVREAYEHVAARPGDWHGRPTHSVPLSRLVDRLPAWLSGEQHALVFFCRSGGRSAKAAECLQRLGHRNAWHVAGALEFDDARPNRQSVAA